MLLKLAVVLISTFIVQITIGQSVDWKKTKNWRIYNYFQFKALSLPIDSVRRYKSIALNDQKVRKWLSDSDTLRRKTDSIAWMGLFTVMYQLNGTERKMEVSVYGGFFYDDFTHRYYEVSDKKKDEWMGYFTNLDLSSFNVP